MARPAGFEWQQRSSGEIVLFHHRKHVTTLRGRRAAKFLADLDHADPQELMARATGNYKRGNERPTRKGR